MEEEGGGRLEEGGGALEKEGGGGLEEEGELTLLMVEGKGVRKGSRVTTTLEEGGRGV